MDSTVQRLAPLGGTVKQLGKEQVVDRYRSLVSSSKRLSCEVQAKSQKLLNDGVDLAINNKASQVVLSGADAVTNRVFTSIEERVHQLARLVSQGQDFETTTLVKRGSFKNYQSRVVGLAQEISCLSNQLYLVLKQDISKRQETGTTKISIYLQKARATVQGHFNSSLTVIRVNFWAPTLQVLADSRADLKRYLQALKQQHAENKVLRIVQA